MHLSLKPDAQPVFKPNQPVSYNMEAVVDELKRLESSGIITYADCTAPIVVVRKPDRTIPICADLSTGLNSALESNSYPFPLTKDIFCLLAQCMVFSHIDLLDTYLQVEFDEESKKHLITKYTYKDPPLQSAFPRSQQCVRRFPTDYGCHAMIDGRNAEEHKWDLCLVLQRLQEYGRCLRSVDFSCTKLSTSVNFWIRRAPALIRTRCWQSSTCLRLTMSPCCDRTWVR